TAARGGYHRRGVPADHQDVPTAATRTAAPLDTDVAAATQPRAPGPAEAAPPTKIGRYTLLRQLGRGGMGVVYAAFDEQLDRKVAVKLLRPHLGGSEGEARLLREAQALARVAHPNVVAVHE